MAQLRAGTHEALAFEFSKQSLRLRLSFEHEPPSSR